MYDFNVIRAGIHINNFQSLSEKKMNNCMNEFIINYAFNQTLKIIYDYKHRPANL